jgi:hypothetical protein
MHVCRQADQSVIAMTSCSVSSLHESALCGWYRCNISQPRKAVGKSCKGRRTLLQTALDPPRPQGTHIGRTGARSIFRRNQRSHLGSSVRIISGLIVIHRPSSLATTRILAPPLSHLYHSHCEHPCHHHHHPQQIVNMLMFCYKYGYHWHRHRHAVTRRRGLGKKRGPACAFYYTDCYNIDR